jgi:DNA-binding protein HU-beta
VTKTELVARVHGVTGLSIAKSGEMVSAFLDIISGELQVGNDVSLPGFGRFSVKGRAARRGRNPKTGAELTIPACKVVSFRAAKALQDSLK